MGQYIIFYLHKKKYALSIKQIECVSRIVEIHPINKQSSHLLGSINFHGTMIFILNLRNLLGLPSKEIELSDNIIICNLEDAKIALLVERIEGIFSCDTKPTDKTPKIPLPDIFQDYIQFNEEIISVFNLEKLFSSAQCAPLEAEK